VSLLVLVVLRLADQFQRIVSSSGSIIVEAVGGGTTAGVSDALTFKSGTSASGPSGDFVVITGAATVSAGGEITVTVGDGENRGG
jgi:hypothetical protein